VGQKCAPLPFSFAVPPPEVVFPMPSRNRSDLLYVAVTLVGLAGLLAGCGTSTPAATLPPQLSPTTDLFESPLVPPADLAPLTPEPGMGGIRGLIVASPPEWGGQEITVYLAAYYAGSEGQGGFFALEPSQAPQTSVTASGAFQMGNVPPRQYVVVIGPGPEEALAIQENAAPKVFEVIAGEILDLGEVRIP
jgi:hypothetical protein